MMRLACMGECMIELCELPDGSLSRRFGGDTLNTAVYLARLGIGVDYVTALGADPFSEQMLAAWTQEGVGTDLVLRSENALPGLYMIQTDLAGERRFSYWRDSAPVRRLFEMPDMPRIERALAGHAVLHLSGITLSLFGETGRAGLFAMLDRLRAGGVRVSFDTNFRPRGWPDLGTARTAFSAMLRRSDIVLAGVEDHRLLMGDTSEQQTLRWAQAPELVVKQVLPGCLVVTGDTVVQVPTAAVDDPVDTTAAGDSFAAGYLAARQTGASQIQAARAGHHLAAEVIRHRGAIIPNSAMPAVEPPP